MERASSGQATSATLIVESLPAPQAASPVVRQEQTTWRTRWPRLLAGGIAFGINALAILGLAHLRAVQIGADVEPRRIEVRVLEDEPRSDASLSPVSLLVPEIEISPPDALPEMNDDLVGRAQIEPPRMDARVSPDFEAYSRKAGLADGELATVVILVDVDTRGRVSRAVVVRSTGGTAIDEAALAYARQTRWLPGRIAGTPSSMQASITVIFGADTQQDARRPPAVTASS